MTRLRELPRVRDGDAGSPLEALGRDLLERGSPDPDWLRAHAPDGDLTALWAACEEPSALFLVLLAGPLRVLLRAATDVAAIVLPVLPADERRAHDAIAAVDAWLRGQGDFEAVLDADIAVRTLAVDLDDDHQLWWCAAVACRNLTTLARGVEMIEAGIDPPSVDLVDHAMSILKFVADTGAEVAFDRALFALVGRLQEAGTASPLVSDAYDAMLELSNERGRITLRSLCDVIRGSVPSPRLADRRSTRWYRARLADEGA